MYMKNHFNIKLTRAFVTAYAVVKEHPKFRWERFKTALKSKSALLLEVQTRKILLEFLKKSINGNLETKCTLLDTFIDKDYQKDEDQE
jgi:hypothetical protein